MNRIISTTPNITRIPLRDTFQTARRRATFTDVVFVNIMTDSGVNGRGSATPLQYVTGETVDMVVTSLQNAAGILSAYSIEDLFHDPGILYRLFPAQPATRAAVEMAVVDAMGVIEGRPAFSLLGGQTLCVETDITIPVVPPDTARILALRYNEAGFSKFKIKVGSDNRQEDIERVFAVRNAVAECSFVLDANQGFSAADALTFIGQMVDHNVQVAAFEQPVWHDDTDALSYVTHNSPVPVFADESACTAADVRELIQQRAVRGVNVKLMKSGFFGALEIGRMCSEAGISLMLGCMLEPREGIAAALQVAAATSSFSLFDLDADMLIADSGTGGYVREGARLCTTDLPGLGFG